MFAYRRYDAACTTIADALGDWHRYDALLNVTNNCPLELDHWYGIRRMTTTNAPSSESRSRRTKRVIAAGVGLAIALVAVEVVLRSAGGVFQDDFTRLDPLRGWSLAPHAAGWTRDENILWIEINGDGMRDREHALAPDAKNVRVAVLGDSYMEGLNVPLEKTFPAFLEAALKRCAVSGTRAPETLNFGVTGYGTAQELLTYRHQVRGYRPDIVVLAFYTGNDVFNNHRDLNPTEFRELSPYFVLDGKSLILDRDFEHGVVSGGKASQPWWRRMRMTMTERSRAAQLLYMAWGVIRDRLEDQGDLEEDGSPEIDDIEIYRAPATPAVGEAWLVTEALLLQIAAEVRADGAEPWIVTLSTADQVNPARAERDALARSLGVESLFYADRRIRAFGETHGIPVVTLAEVLADESAAQHIFFHGGYNDEYPAGTGHWNELGNQRASQLVAARLCADSPAMRSTGLKR